MTLTLKQHAYQVIREKLLNGEFDPGGRLSDDALARELGISRSPVREAISQLSTEGLVTHRPRSGAYVREPTPDELRELYEIREALEAKAAGMAAERMDENQVAELQQLCDQMRKLAVRCRKRKDRIADASLTDQFLANDLEFHLAILRGAQNQRMLQMVHDFKLMTRVFGNVSVVHNLEIIARSYRHHVTVLKAIRSRDSAAAMEWMTRHISIAREYVLNGITKQTQASQR